MSERPSWFPEYENMAGLEGRALQDHELLWDRAVAAGVQAAIGRIEAMAPEFRGWYRATVELIAEKMKDEIGLPSKLPRLGPDGEPLPTDKDMGLEQS